MVTAKFWRISVSKFTEGEIFCLFGYDLSDEELESMLSGRGMREAN